MIRPELSRLGPLSLGLVVFGAGCDVAEETPPEPPEPLEIAEDIFASLGEPAPYATAEQLAAFERGLEVVTHRWTPEEGLGPRFNVAFCGACHEKPVFGGSAGRYRDFYLSASVLSDGSYVEPPMAGIAHFYGIGDAPLRPGIEGNWNIQARRNPIPFFGTGLIAELPDEAILANADPDDEDGDGISGRPNWDDGFVGRFGRKSQTVSIEGFIRGPLANHLGITSNPLTDEQRARLPVDSSLAATMTTAELGTTIRQPQAAPPSEPLTDEDDAADPELSPDQLFDVVSYAMLLAAPEPSPWTVESQNGLAVFREVGCDGCHVETLPGPRGLIPLYSDLLLHDMGEDMADGIQMGVASGAEFRTQPLWGISAVGPYLHDGRADTLAEAIEAHGGEAAASADAFRALSSDDAGDLIAFLEGLGGLEQRTDGLVPPTAEIPATGTAGGPLRAFDDTESANWLEGRRLFDRDTYVSEGLGPLFNGDSCRACHFDPAVGGAGPIGVNVTRHGAWNGDQFTAPDGGTILHKFTLFPVWRPEADATANAFEGRQTPHVFGLGLIEQIDREEILAAADPDDEDGDGISGRAHILADGRLGRLGWKAQVPSVREFVRDAMGAEVGMTVPIESGYTFGSTTDDDDVADPELSVEDVDALEFYLAQLAPLAAATDAAGGREVFDSVGCGDCHTPTFETPSGPAHLYSDLLLHDVAEEGAVGIPDGDASETEFRTPPLWGLGATAPYMHDGRASTVEAAVRAHAGEATASVQAFEVLVAADRAALVSFLEGL